LNLLGFERIRVILKAHIVGIPVHFWLLARAIQSFLVSVICYHLIRRFFRHFSLFLGFFFGNKADLQSELSKLYFKLLSLPLIG